MIDPLTAGSLRIVDLVSPAILTYLTLHAAPVLQGQGFENLDVAALRGPSRLPAGANANWFYSRTDKNGQPLYARMHSVSRPGHVRCSAIFDGTPVEVRSSAEVSRIDPALSSILELFSIRLR